MEGDNPIAAALKAAVDAGELAGAATVIETAGPGPSVLTQQVVS